MKLLRVIPTMAASWGGPVAAVRYLTPELERRGVSTEFATLDAEPPTQAEPFLVHRLGPRVLNYGFSKKLFVWLRENVNRYDVVVLHGAWQFTGLATWLALRSGSPPYFVYPHGMLEPWSGERFPLKRHKKAVYWRLIEQHVVGNAMAVLFTSQEEKRIAEASFHPFAATKRVVNYGVGVGTANLPDARARFEKQCPSTAGKECALYLGRLHPKKGLEVLLRSFSQVSAQRSDLHLVVAGPGDSAYVDSLITLARSLGVEDRITLTGMLEGDLKWGAMGRSVVLVQPSHQESFGISIVEALSIGLPVVISNKVYIWPEIVQDGAGLAAEDTPEGIAGALATFLSFGQEQRRAMGAKARDCYNSRYEISVVADSFLKTLGEFGLSVSR